ncbi:MAG: ATP-binding protein [Solirubrobacteraceae bacterium]|nr:ATP-binding protein [Solirubrobacteraceae bacterium]
MSTEREDRDRAWWDSEFAPGVGGAGMRRASKRARRRREREERTRQRGRLREDRRQVTGAERRVRDRQARERENELRDAVRTARRERQRIARWWATLDEPWPLLARLAAMAGLPVAMSAEQYPHVATTRSVAAVYPFLNEEGLGHRGPVIGLNVTGGGAFSFDPWNLYSRTARSATPDPDGPKAIQNANIVVIGQPGNGKSSLVKTLAWRQAVFGRRVEFIDPKGEYCQLVEALGGVTIKLGPKGPQNPNPQSLNPLTDRGDPAARGSLLQSLCRAVLSRPLTPREEVGSLAALAQADRAAAAAGGYEVCLPHVEAALRDPDEELARALNGTKEYAREELRDLMLKFHLLSKGPLAGMFDRPTSIPHDTWERQAISIDLSDMRRLAGDEEGRNLPLAVTMMCCSAFLTAAAIERAQRCAAEGIVAPPTLRVNDEGWRVLAIPGQAQQYQSDFKLQRSSGVANVLVMHRFSDLRSIGDDGSRARELAKGLLADADTRIIYKQDEGELADVREKLDLTETASSVVATLEPGQALWQVGQWWGLVHHLRSRREVELTDTDGAMAPGLPTRTAA